MPPFELQSNAKDVDVIEDELEDVGVEDEAWELRGNSAVITMAPKPTSTAVDALVFMVNLEPSMQYCIE